MTSFHAQIGPFVITGQCDALRRMTGAQDGQRFSVSAGLVTSTDGVTWWVLESRGVAAMAKPRQTRRDKWAKRPAVVRYREWCSLLRRVASPPDPNTVDSFNWMASFQFPARWRKSLRVGGHHRQRPDRDNLDKAFLDCLWPDSDSGIAAGWIQKVWAEKNAFVVAARLG